MKLFPYFTRHPDNNNESKMYRKHQIHFYSKVLQIILSQLVG